LFRRKKPVSGIFFLHPTEPPVEVAAELAGDWKWKSAE
jgi:hypothetical protein